MKLSPLRLSLVAATILICSSSPYAFANCERYEFAELKSMKTADLKLNYCLNAIEMQRQTSIQAQASKLADLEVQNPMGANRRLIERNDATSGAAAEKIRQCRVENERILSIIGKKLNVAALAKECPTK